MTNRKKKNDNALKYDSDGESELNMKLSNILIEENSEISEAEEVGINELELEDVIDGYSDYNDDDEVGEDLYGENFMKDYEKNPELDKYDEDIIDDREYEEDIDAKKRAEIAMIRRDAIINEKKSKQVISKYGVTYLMGNDEDTNEDSFADKRRKKRELFRNIAEESTKGINVETLNELIQDLPLAEQVEFSDHIQSIIYRLFKIFIYDFKLSSMNQISNNTIDNNLSDLEQFEHSYYLKKIEEMAQHEKISIYVDVRHIFTFCYKLWDYVNLYSILVLNCFNICINDIVKSMHPTLYNEKSVTIRLIGLDYIDHFRDLRVEWLNQLIRVSGIITRRTNVLTKYKTVFMECVKCGCDTLGPYEDGALNSTYIDSNSNKTNSFRNIGKCTDCQSKGPFIINREKTIYENYQKLLIQEPPSSVPAGRIPRSRDVIITGDLVDSVCPGEEVIITGVYCTYEDRSLNIKTGFPVLGTQIYCNNIEKRYSQSSNNEITEDDINKIKELSKDPDIKEKIIASIAPSIYGHNHIKTAIACSLFGGVRKNISGKFHHIRGDINVLLVGDPGLAKSQFLKYVEKTFDRTIYTSGKGASAVGLTASVRRDPISNEWALEGGALVLADEGICLIDEFDKMSDKDRVSIHEAMEQQSISISKAGIVTTLRARCSIIAAANPIYGRYDSSLTFKDNVNLSDPIISRFDILAVLKDEVHSIKDEILANFVVQSHMAAMNHENNIDIESSVVNPPIDQDLLRKYIHYARKLCSPQIKSVDKEKITNFYSKIRQEAMNTGGITMTVRHIESVIRISESHAKMRLSPIVTNRDVDIAIGIMLESFIQSQKYAVAQRLDRVFARYRAISSGFINILENLLLQLYDSKIKKMQLNNWSDEQINQLVEQIDHISINLDDFLASAEMIKLSHNVTYAYLKSSAFSRRFIIKNDVDESGTQIKNIYKKIA